MNKIMLLIGDYTGNYAYLFWIGFTILCVIVTCMVLRNEEKIVAKTKKKEYIKSRRGVPT